MKTAKPNAPHRRHVLQGRFDAADVLRPPGACGPEIFENLCTHCGDCAEACPQAIITADQNGFPILDVSLRACTFCGKCTEVCKTEALSDAHPWMWRADIAETCLSVHAISCRACEDHCDEVAVRFRLMTTGRAQPEIDRDLCSGCGACVGACPTQSISLRRVAPSTLPAHSQPARPDHVQHLRMPRSRDA
ncbi:ferredoxin-type protein NapF [Shimia sp. R11_0]|uniref:ferredoxin-type protein NapF n=1 Tax=Shimia sp. R11_0 TaxID=2821096 RepID=UPI001ADBC358|nr:ferredoxin-type protein NapF [Shimia sp. R11_0]MBO9477041.1 ferredoxin-type protein NapF [Shimia sp. R11_0]